MPAPDLIQQQREILRRFRQATQQRTQSEQAAETRRKSELAAAETALKQAQQSAQALLTKSTSELETRHKSTTQAAEQALTNVRSQANRHSESVRTAYSQAKSTLENIELESLLEQTPHKVTSPTVHHVAQDELADCATTAQQALKELTEGVDQLILARQRAAMRRRQMWIIAAVAGVILVIGAMIAISAWQEQQRLQQAQAIVTTVAMQVQATATTIAPLFKPLEERFGMRFVLVPAGEFTMGSPDGVGNDDERPQHPVQLDAFLIGVTEVTNAQYRPFVEAGGYTKLALWTEQGWAWRQQANVSQPECWDDPKWNQADFPVVCISWYEAVAYTRWLSAVTGLAVRLPTEAEWEKAARGTEGRMFPWGNTEPTEQLLNFNQNKGGTTAVGSYPAGVSPYGALDMAGNVWEWTSTAYKTYPYQVDDGREEVETDNPHVLRGGSWFFNSSGVRAAYRLRYDPDSRDINVGVRLVVSPSF